MRIVTFGEVMGRLAAPGFSRLRQALPGTLDVTFAGAEANVAASLACYGAEVALVTALPEHEIADACLGSLRNAGIDTRYVVRRDGRLGLYFLETGANQRPSRVIYDRAGSSISLARASEFPWPEIFDGVGWFHITGITPALSSAAAEATAAALRAAKQAGVTVSCDLNYRKKLWRYDESSTPRDLAEATMRGLLPFVDVVIANEEDCHDVLGIRTVGADVQSGRLDAERYPDVARRLVEQFPSVSRVGITLRQSVSASHNNWGGMLYCAQGDRAHFAPLIDDRYAPYEIRDIVDRVGAGDAFAAGLIFALTTPGLAEGSEAIRFAVAASCLAHSIPGDFNWSSRAEVEALMQGSVSGRVIR